MDEILSALLFREKVDYCFFYRLKCLTFGDALFQIRDVLF